MGPFARPSNILFISRYLPKDSNGQKRKELFERQIKLTEEEHGNASVNYAWFGAKRIKTIGALIHGFGSLGKPTKGILGTGLYLTLEGHSFASVHACDVDEKEMQYMILCQVIFSNLEQVHPGSKQYYPSSSDYDSGVDNLLDPKCYVVWSTRVSTYIHPEYLESFKLAPTVQVELLVQHHQELKNKVIDRDELVKKPRFLIGDQLLISVLNRFNCDEPSLWHEGPSAKKMKLDVSPAPWPDGNKKNVANPGNDGTTQNPGNDGTTQRRPGPNSIM